MTRFRKRPVVIEAVLYDGTFPLAFLAEGENVGSAGRCADGALNIYTLEGTMRAEIGDWIIRGVAGELYPCKPDIFEKTYELAEGLPAPLQTALVAMANGCGLIVTERLRQIEAEGYPPEHDDEHDDETLAQAAAIYATPSRLRDRLGFGWPWSLGPGFKTGDRVRDLVKAGALIAAEIDRLKRVSAGDSEVAV